MTIVYYHESEGGTDQPVLPYLLFGGVSYFDAREGVRDLLASANTVEELKQITALVGKNSDLGNGETLLPSKWYQIVEHKTLRVIEEGHPNED